MFLLQPWDKPTDYSDQVTVHTPPLYVYSKDRWRSIDS